MTERVNFVLSWLRLVGFGGKFTGLRELVMHGKTTGVTMKLNVTGINNPSITLMEYV